MTRLLGITGIFAISLAAAVPAQALPMYITADFSGGVSRVTKLGNELGFRETDTTCAGCAESSVSGHLLFDTGLTPAKGSGVVNVPLASVAGASNDLIFDIVFGKNTLQFDFDDADSQSGAAIQFRNGIFHGLSFAETFMLDERSFALSMRGKVWDIKAMDTKGAYSRVAASGYLNTGDAGLTNRQTFVPVSGPDAELPASVPEPATLALLALGFLGLAVARRRRQQFVQN